MIDFEALWAQHSRCAYAKHNGYTMETLEPDRAVMRLEKEKRQKALEYIAENKLNVAQTDSYIEKLLTPKKAKGRTIIHIKDIRIFTNTITKAVNIIKTAGFAPQFEQNTTENAVEYKIVIPLEKPHTSHREKQSV